MSGIVREYNDELEETLEGYVQKDLWYNPRTWDWIQYFNKHVNIDNYINDIKQYHKDIIDVKDYSKEKIKEIFNNVDEVDRDFSAQYKDLNDKLINFKVKVKAITDLMKPTVLNFSPEVYEGVIAQLNNIGDSLIKEIEEGKNGEYIPEYVTAAQLEEMGWKNVSDEFVKQLNASLDKYGLTDNKQIRYFISECYAELGGDTGSDFLEIGGAKKRYAPYYGAGNIQITFKYGYQAYATYLALEEYPELQEKGVNFKNPKNNGPDAINSEYEKLIKTAKELNIDISKYTDIVDIGPKYVAENFAFDSAAYFWVTKGIKTTVEGFEADSISNLTTVSHMVNGGDNGKAKREEGFDAAKEIFKDGGN